MVVPAGGPWEGAEVLGGKSSPGPGSPQAQGRGEGEAVPEAAVHLTANRPLPSGWPQGEAPPPRPMRHRRPDGPETSDAGTAAGLGARRAKVGARTEAPRARARHTGHRPRRCRVPSPSHRRRPRGAPPLRTPLRFALTSPKAASPPQRIFLVFWVKPGKERGGVRRRRGSTGRPPGGRQTPSPPGPTSEAEMHLPLAAARQPREPPDSDAERHGAGADSAAPLDPA